MEKRILSVFIAFTLVFNLLILRVYFISTGDTLAQAAINQSTYTLELGASRGYIYDVDLRPLVNTGIGYTAVAQPVPEALNALITQGEYEDTDLLIEKMEEHVPFTVEVENSHIYSNGINVYKTLDRYAKDVLAPHIVGHLDGDGDGVMGAELAFNDYLSSHSGQLAVKYVTNAYGEVLTDARKEQINSNYNDLHGVVLTIDSEIQEIAENAMRDIESGSVVIMEVSTGDIKAAVSVPDFQPNNIAEGLDDPLKPFFNRIYAPTAIGSTFKMIIAATAIEKGFSLNTTYTCDGSIEVGGTEYACHFKNGHGAIDLTTAAEISCNPYFIQLAQAVGEQNIAYKAAQMGFGQSVEIMPGVYTGTGVLPSFKELENIGEAANFSIGQGRLTASPIQIAQMISAIANDGVSVIPRVVEGYSNDGERVDTYTEVNVGSRVFEEWVAKEVQKIMTSVVEEGSGINAKPYVGGAGGKTGSAQTGVYEDEVEIVHAWFAGFFPVEEPKYTIVVLAEGGDSGGDVCAPVFKEIADRMRFVEDVS